MDPVGVEEYTEGMPSNWNKGFTKYTHPSLMKASETMKLRGIDNFAGSRIKIEYPEFEKNGDLAELIGVTLGDGTITKYARTEEIRIISNANNPGFVGRYSQIIEKIFKKKPYVAKNKDCNAIRISLYQKNISVRLGIPTGKRGDLTIAVPDWILENKEYIVRYLRGLYEAEGSFSVHEATYTHKFQFANRNPSMLANVFALLRMLGFHPHMSKYQVQISKKKEVYEALEVLNFRKY